MRSVKFRVQTVAFKLRLGSNCRVWSAASKGGECKVLSVTCGVQSAQCRENFKGPPSAMEWTFGSVGKSNAVSDDSAGREADVRTQHDNRARRRFHTVSSVKRTKL